MSNSDHDAADGSDFSDTRSRLKNGRKRSAPRKSSTLPAAKKARTRGKSSVQVKHLGELTFVKDGKIWRPQKYTLKLRRKGHPPLPVKFKPGEGVYRVQKSVAQAPTVTPAARDAFSKLLGGLTLFEQNSVAGNYSSTLFKDQDQTNTKSKKQRKPTSNDLEEDEDDAEDDAEAQEGCPTNLDPNVPPVSTLPEVYNIIAGKLVKQNFDAACAPFARRGLQVVTMCSGTESPILAMKLLDEALARRGVSGLPVNHLASAEIEPFKQAYIHRNFEPPILFRDVTEFITEKEHAHTAFGGLAKQPTDVDILIAGSSCVDYSTLRGAIKKFGEEGQSFNTFSGVRSYVATHRPAIVILENVLNASWVDFQQSYEEIDYYGVVIIVDTKDFYIPQTRKRGYMVAFDQRRAEEIGLDLQKAASTLIQSIKTLAQRASSPYVDFIYKDDDQDLKLARQGIAEVNLGHHVDWTACKLRYAGHRMALSLGNKRPLTFWRAGGRCQFSDYAWMNWVEIQRERIFDTLDINYLKCVAQRHFDMTYKSLVIELSQNVDRDENSRHWGIVSCITPSGMPWDTLRGGPIFGKEALALQGIPVNELSLNRETSRQLQDLAGNAMTSTVVGSIVFSAIIASCRELVEGIDVSTIKSAPTSMFRHTNLSTPKTAPQGSSAIHRHQVLAQLPLVPSPEKQVDGVEHIASTLEQVAGATLSLCKCDKSPATPAKKHFWCVLCGHTACAFCAGNPSHNYREMPDTMFDARKEPQEFVRGARKEFPSVLQLQAFPRALNLLKGILDRARNFNDHQPNSDDNNPKKLTEVDQARYQAAVLGAFTSIVFLQDIKGEALWRVIYASDQAQIELRITACYQVSSQKMTSEWLVYAKPAVDEPSVSVVRELLRRPIARMKPDGPQIMQGKWEIWDPLMPCAQLEVQGRGEPQPSWEQKLGLQNETFKTLQVYPRLRIQLSPGNNDALHPAARNVAKGFCGDYRVLPDCGTAAGSLYEKHTGFHPQPGPKWLFLDPKPLQNATLDRMVFADTHDRFPYGVERLVMGEFAKSWRFNSNTLSDATATAIVPCRLIDLWCASAEVSFVVPQQFLNLNKLVLIPPPHQLLSQYCDASISIIFAKLPTADIAQPQWIHGHSYPFKLIDQPAALQEFQWLLKQASTELPQTHGRIDITHDLSECHNCAPPVPRLEWHYTRNMKGTQAVIKPFENVEAATAHEQALLRRPIPVTATVVPQSNGASITVDVNFTSVVHRLHSRLALDQVNGDVVWRVIQNDGFDAFTVFKKPELLIGTKSKVIWPKQDKMYMDKQDAVKPQLFVGRSLWETQRKALSWMMKVEQGVKWQEWDAEAYDLQALNLQLQIEATSKVVVRSGIIADKVGGGKTTTSLALVARGLETQSLQQSPAVTPNNKINLQATLILVPKNIIGQWMKEMTACFGPAWISQNVEELSTAKWDVAIRKLRRAKIIIAPWDLFGENSYWMSMSKVCCAPNVPQKGGRAFKQWLDEVDTDLRDIVQSCGPELRINDFRKHRKDQRDRKEAKYIRFEAFHTAATTAANKTAATKAKATKPPASRVIAVKTKTNVTQTESTADDPDQEDDVTQGSKYYPGASEIDVETAKKEFEEFSTWKSMQMVSSLLHFFHFNRIIVDEFTYPDARVLLAIQMLSATHRWMMSGTPPLSTPESINCMGMLIGTKVYCENEADLTFSFKSTRTVGPNEKSYSEEFRARIEKRLPAWERMRNNRAAAFVNELLLQNEPNPISVQQINHFIVLPQSSLEACIYNQAYQKLTSRNLSLGWKGAAKAGQTGFLDLDDLIAQAESREEVLLSCHAACIELCSRSSDATAIEAFIDDLYPEINATMEKILKNWQECNWYIVHGQAAGDPKWMHPYYANFYDMIQNETFGNVLVSHYMTSSMEKAETDLKKPRHMKSKKDKVPYDENAVHNVATRKGEIQARATKLNDKCTLLGDQSSQLQLLYNIHDIATGKNLDCEVCEQHPSVEESTLLSHCGHLVCASCLNDGLSAQDDIGACPAHACSASTKGCQVPAKAYLGNQGKQTSKYGSKMDAIASTILSIKKEECVLVFVQFKAHIEQLIRLFEERGIPYLNGTKDSRIVEAFQNRKDSTRRVLILQLDSADSSGWNLQVANHVVFVTPFLVKSQYDWEATMEQAVGRALRFGQGRDVNVYHFLYSGTLDVSILQDRMGGKLVEGEEGRFELVEGGDARALGEDHSGLTLDAE